MCVYSKKTRTDGSRKIKREKNNRALRIGTTKDSALVANTILMPVINSIGPVSERCYSSAFETDVYANSSDTLSTRRSSGDIVTPGAYAQSPVSVFYQTATSKIDIHMNLIEDYFNTVNKANNYFHKDLFIKNIHNASPFTLCTMYARSSFYKGNKELSRNFYEISKQCSGYLLENPSAEHVLSILDNAFHPCNGDGAYAWMLLTLSVKMARQLELHRESAEQAKRPSQTYEQEMSRRAFWSTALVDRFGLLVSRAYSTLSNENLLVGLPLSDDVHKASTLPQETEIIPTMFSNMGMTKSEEGAAFANDTSHWSFHVRLSKILARIGSYLSTVETLPEKESETKLALLNKAMERWFESLVVNLRSYGITDCWQIINPSSPLYRFAAPVFEYHVGRILLNLPAMFRAIRQDPITAPDQPSFKIAFETAKLQVRGMRRLLVHGKNEILVSKMRMSDGFFSGLALLFALQCPQFENDQNLAQQFDYCYNDLAEISKDNPIACAWWKMLKEIKSKNVESFLPVISPVIPII